MIIIDIRATQKTATTTTTTNFICIFMTIVHAVLLQKLF